MRILLSRFRKDQSATTAIEYGLIAALLSITILAAATNIGGGVVARWEEVDTFVAQ